MGDKSFLDYEIQDVLPTSAAGFCAWCCSSVVGIVLIVLFFPCTVTQLGQWKLGLVRNKVTGYVDLDNPHTPGRYWIGFWKEFVEFPSTLQTIEFSTEAAEEGVRHLSVLTSRDMDGKLIKLDISVQYRLELENIGKIYRDMLIYYEDIYISELRDAFAKAANLFSISDVWENYTSVVDKMRDRCEFVLSRRHAECWGLQLWGVTLSREYDDKVVLTQVRKQAAKTEKARTDQLEIRAQTQVDEEEIQKHITIVKAGGVARVYDIEREAYAIAQANFVSAQAEALRLVKNQVCPTHAKDNATGNCSTAPWVMSPKQLVKYQKMMLLKTMNESQLIYNMRSGDHPEAMNVEASKNIMNGIIRRRLLDSRRLDAPQNTLIPLEASPVDLEPTIVNELSPVTAESPDLNQIAHEL